MRIHRLDLVAFGPFADPVSVDLDTLSDAGLFLLTGATGAGKTSVLDAICFALYGAVPGDRQGAKRLRSDHAPTGTAPEVVLELTVAGRRLRITRSPAWQRPKKRGTGTTTEQARVLVEERVADSWRPLATRLDEAGHLVAGLLGMNLTQFCQVQMLPQGRFQAFLRADSGERHDLLQKLFRTARFEAVEGWLRDHRRRLRREAGRHHDRVADLVSRTSEAAGCGLPEEWDVHALAPVAGEIGPWTRRLLREATAAHRSTATRVEQAAAAEAATRRTQEAGRRRHDRQLRLARAREERETLAADEEAQRERADRLDAAHRAAVVLPVLEEDRRAEAELARTTTAATAAVTTVAALLGVDPIAEDRLGTHQQQAAAAAAEARALEPLVDERRQLAGRLERDQADRSTLTAELESVEQQLEALPERVARSRAAEDSAQQAATRLVVARQEAASAEERVASGRLVERLRAERADARSRLQAAVDAAQSLKEEWLSIQERRLTGMAAEIAGGLAVGADCPVCGSADHPRPAQPAPDAPDGAAEREARRLLDDAELERHAREGAVRDLDLRIEHAGDQARNLELPALEQEAAAATALAERLAAAVEAGTGARTERERAERDLADATARRGDLRARLASLAAAEQECRRRVAEIDDRLDRALAGTDAPSVSVLAERWTEVERACAAALGEVDARERAERVAARARGRLTEALTEHGFDDGNAVGAAGLPPEQQASLAERVRAHEVRLATVEALLGDPDLLEADLHPAPDLEQLDAAQEGAEAELTAARAGAARAQERAERLGHLTGDLVDTVDAWLPLLADLDLADRLAALADGSSTDNRLRMRLSGYVLAYRLRQVVAAANERLVGMTDGRYRLEHTGERGAGESRGGLSLVVCDDWTGDPRDPVTLSGGETFVVSLALALGLSDVITAEAGGAELDTLFVDEGFGTLDADTLDDVMDMLDSLRDGGRVVGVVSHVAELRDRIPTQLHVRKLRTGSTIGQGAVG